MNKLYYGDNLDVLRAEIASESVDLVYLDPPFNSNANYNILFKSPAGKAADSQIEAFEDSWHWNDKAEGAFHDVMVSGNTDVAELLRAMRGFLKENDMMAYLAMMAVRLIELHRVLKPTGSLYLHCDPTASHYLKLLLDGVFGAGFQNEIVWERTNSHNLKTVGWTRSNDTIFFYTKTNKYTFNTQYTDYGPEQMKRFKADEAGRLYKAENMTFSSVNKNRQFEWRGTKPPENRSWGASLEQLEQWWSEGRILKRKDGSPRMDGLKIFLDETKGKPIGTNWNDIGRVGNTATERLGYPTQKPLALLERIIAASSNPGDVVLDPFCGCGTAVDAAQKLGRQWIGIDVTHLSIGLIERRMQDRYGPNLAARPLKNPPRNGEGDHEVVEGPRRTSGSSGGEAPPSAVPAATSPTGGGLAYEVIGTPNDIASAEKLAADEPHQFQYWITQAIDGQPFQGGRKGMDRGIDGYVYFTGHDRKTEAAIISVKAGRNVGVAMVRDLKGVVEREKAPIGIFVCVINPTREMEREAASAGVYEAADGRTYPKLQLYTIAEYFAGLRPKVPLLDRQAAYKKAARADDAKQSALDL